MNEIGVGHLLIGFTTGMLAGLIGFIILDKRRSKKMSETDFELLDRLTNVEELIDGLKDLVSNDAEVANENLETINTALNELYGRVHRLEHETDEALH